LKTRLSTVAICASSWLLAGSAVAAGPFANFSKNSMPQLRLENRDLLRPANVLASPSLLSRGTNHHRLASFRDFPATPAAGNAVAIDPALPLPALSSGFAVNEAQSGPFRFEHRGGAVVHEIPRGYRRMCDSLSGHLWNDPGGKRVCFDMRGKPGIAIQIPIN